MNGDQDGGQEVMTITKNPLIFGHQPPNISLLVVKGVLNMVNSQESD